MVGGVWCPEGGRERVNEVFPTQQSRKILHKREGERGREGGREGGGREGMRCPLHKVYQQ